MTEFIMQFLMAMMLRQEAEQALLKNVPVAQMGPQRVASETEKESLGIRATADHIALVDAQTGKLLYGKKENEARPIASITKLMSALVFFDTKPDLEKSIVITEADHREGSKDMFLVGEEVRLRDVLKAAFMMSNNSAVAVLTRSTGMTEAEFVVKMNEKAKALGLKKAVFTDPTGYDSGNVATPLEVAVFAKTAFDIADLQEILSSPREVAVPLNKKRSFFIYNTNHLIGSFLNAGNYTLLAGKTGTTDVAGNCLVTLVEKEGSGSVLSVVLGSETGESRFSETKGLVYWAFENYVWKN